MSRRGLWWCSGLLLTGALSLCVIGPGASAEPVDVSGAIGLSRLDAPGSIPPCPPSPADEGHVSAIYLDLEAPLLLDIPQLPERLPLGRVHKQQWFCADSDRLDVGRSPTPGAGVGIDLISPDPSASTLILESGSGEIWEIELASLDGDPLEPGAFASDAAAFFVNRIEWSEEGELASLDADFEVDLARGDSLRGRVLWNAAWTPDEAPFVPLADHDRVSAWPGEVSIEGPALDRLFPATPFQGISQTAAVPAGERVDSIRYSREPAVDPEAARAEVAEDMASLSERKPIHAAATPRGSSSGVASFAAAARTSAPGSATPGMAAAEHSFSLRLGVPFSTRSTAQTQPIPTPGSGGPSQRINGISPDRVPAGIGDREPWWLDSPDHSTPAAEPDRASASLRSGARACSPGDGVRCQHTRASEDPSPAYVSEGSPNEVAVGLAVSDPRNAPPIDPRALPIRDRLETIARGSEAGGSDSIRRLIEECWLALRTIAARWLDAMNAFLTETRP